MIATLLTLAALAGPAGDPVKTVTVGAVDRPVDVSLAWRSLNPLFLEPGLALRAERTLATRDLRVESARHPRGFRHRTRDLWVGGDLGADVKLYNNTLFRLQGMVGTRVVRTSGYTTGLTLGVGLTRSVLNHPSWVVRDDGSVRRTWLRGQWGTMASLSYELGWDSQRRRETRRRRGKTERPPLEHPHQWFVRPTVALQYPWIRYTVPAVYVDLGVRFGLPAIAGRSR